MSLKNEKINYSLQTIDLALSPVIELMTRYKIFALHGEMGAGKTTFIRKLFHKIGVSEPVTSPTFAYVNKYFLPLHQTYLYHFDLYRLRSADEFYALALDYCFEDESAFIFIEWPEIIVPIISETHPLCHLYFKHTQNSETRELVIKT